MTVLETWGATTPGNFATVSDDQESLVRAEDVSGFRFQVSGFRFLEFCHLKHLKPVTLAILPAESWQGWLDGRTPAAVTY
jgi:hypothetical protein